MNMDIIKATDSYISARMCYKKYLSVIAKQPPSEKLEKLLIAVDYYMRNPVYLNYEALQQAKKPYQQS